MSFFEQGRSTRSHKLNRSPIFHMLVHGPRSDWVTWCGGSTAYIDHPGGYGAAARLCRTCRHLVADNMSDDMISQDEAGWFWPQPTTTPTTPASDIPVAEQGSTEDLYPDENLPFHYLDDDGIRQRGPCPWSGHARTKTGGCPHGCASATEHYSNDGHEGCAESDEAAS